MALFEVAIQKQLGSEYWLNCYHVDVADRPAARAAGLEIANVESNVHSSAVTFVNYRIRQVSQLAEAGSTYPLGFTGTQSAYSYLSLFNVARVDFAVPVGRPSRKYLKLPVGAGSVNNGVFIPAFITFVQTQYCGLILGVEGICDNNGQTFEVANVNPTVGMRQLRRGTRKRETPIIP